MEQKETMKPLKRWRADITVVSSETLKGMFPADTVFKAFDDQFMIATVSFDELTELAEIVERGPHFSDIRNINVKYMLR